MAKKKHDIRELLSMLPEAGVCLSGRKGDVANIHGQGILWIDRYTHRLALACYCMEVCDRLRQQYIDLYGYYYTRWEMDSWHGQELKALIYISIDFMEWAEQ